jgi:hypothetical protein
MGNRFIFLIFYFILKDLDVLPYIISNYLDSIKNPRIQSHMISISTIKI